MLYNNKKIIESLVEPPLTNVLWLHTKLGQSPVLKQFEGGIWKEIDLNVLKITSNNLTDDQKEQFRENIQAANQAEVNFLTQLTEGILKEIDLNVLKITSNNLTDDQKEQFRENIQAANQAEVNFLTQLTEDLLATDSGELIVTDDYDFIIAI